jgi:transposase
MRVDSTAVDVIQAPKLEPRIMRYELSDCEWTTIKPMLPNKRRGVRRVNDRRVLNGIFSVLRSGAPWRDLPENYGPYLLQSLRAKAGWYLGPDHGSAGRRPQDRRACAPARSLCRGE